MKTICNTLKATLLVVLTFSLLSFTLEPSFNTDYENDAAAQKLTSREFTADNNTTLQVSNSYGNIKIMPWNQEKVKVDVYVIYDKNIRDTKDYQQKSFKVEMAQNGNSISINTKHTTSRIKHTINYVIYTPSTTQCLITNKYGDIVLGNLSGFISANLAYGNMFAENLSFGNGQKANELKLSYGDATIKSAAWFNTTIAYGSLKLGECYAIGLNSAYSDVKINAAKFINTSASYSDVNLGTVNSIKGKLTHTDLKADKLNDNILLSVAYSDVVLNTISKTFKNIDIQGMYTDGKITFESASEFKLEGISKYSGFKLYNLGNGSQNIEGSFTRTIGTNPSRNVKIDMQYGDWLITRN